MGKEDCKDPDTPSRMQVKEIPMQGFSYIMCNTKQLLYFDINAEIWVAMLGRIGNSTPLAAEL